MNSHGLTWIFTEPSQQVIFMDLKISITADGLLSTNLYEKPMALYLFIPPKSAHSPGVFKGLVYGQVTQIFCLCSHLHDIQRHLWNFFERLCKRGYSPSEVIPVMNDAAKHAESFMQLSSYDKLQKKKKQLESNKRKLFLHVPYHPQDPPSSVIQRLFTNTILFPAGEEPLFEIRNQENQKITKDGLITCYHRHPNLGNIFSVRKLCKREGSDTATILQQRTLQPR